MLELVDGDTPEARVQRQSATGNQGTEHGALIRFP
jgi:hypothetical protein